MAIRRCSNCGCEDFLIQETIVHKAATSEEDGELTAYKVFSHVIEIIFCEQCEKEYSEEDFENINF
ncbi:MAG: hypothetical protein HY098_07900 [Nitrospinae bacterium]|nr:hypothetical protein [Nitrospinota bacterium]